MDHLIVVSLWAVKCSAHDACVQRDSEQEHAEAILEGFLKEYDDQEENTRKQLKGGDRVGYDSKAKSFRECESLRNHVSSQHRARVPCECSKYCDKHRLQRPKYPCKECVGMAVYVLHDRRPDITLQGR